MTGALEWHRVFSADAYLLQVAVDTFDNCLAVGFLLGDVDLGGGMLSPGQSASVALVSLDESGNHRFSQSFGSGAAYFVAHDEDTGGFVIAGYYAGDLDLGGGALPFASDTDVFVAKLAP